jgi:hypothetical protein
MLRFIFCPLLYPPICVLFLMTYERVLPAMDNFADATEIIYIVLLLPALAIAELVLVRRGRCRRHPGSGQGSSRPRVEGVLSLGAVGALAALCCRWIFQGAASGRLAG